jgi:uncharacterized coiled-coil protein SlyX
MKTIHALTIIDKSGSMLSFRSRTIEGINSMLASLKTQVDKDIKILNTLLMFSSIGKGWGERTKEETEESFVFHRVGQEVSTVPDLTEKEYAPDGGTPLLDAIGYGIEKIKEFHKDDLGSDDLSIIVSVFSDGMENSSQEWNKDKIKQMIDHFQSDKRWTFTFIGCGSFDEVSGVSSTLGISNNNTVAYAASAEGNTMAFRKMSNSYSNYTRGVKGLIDIEAPDFDIFSEVKEPEITKK